MIGRFITLGLLVAGLALAMASGMGVLTQSLSFENPSYEYQCIPIIDGEEQEMIEPTNSRTFTVSSGEHELNTRFMKNGSEVEVGTARTVLVDQATSVKCYGFME
ncbi:MAG: hypothetical protein ABIJ09_00435 [Pseudomonadota bacterium]